MVIFPELLYCERERERERERRTQRIIEPKPVLTNIESWGAWLAQLVEHATLDLRVVNSSPMLSIEITSE